MHSSFGSELKDPAWECPNITSFDVANDPFLAQGYNLNYVVNYCTVINPTNSTCASVEESASAVSRLRLVQKFVRQYFNPNTYESEKTMKFVATNRIEQDFIGNTSFWNMFLLD